MEAGAGETPQWRECLQLSSRTQAHLPTGTPVVWDPIPSSDHHRLLHASPQASGKVVLKTDKQSQPKSTALHMWTFMSSS